MKLSLASPRDLGIGMASSRISTFGRLLTNFRGGVGIRTDTDMIQPQLWVSPVYCLFQRKHHVEGNMDLVPFLLYTHILKILFLLFSHFASHGGGLSLYNPLYDFLFRAHHSLVLGSSEGLNHSSLLISQGLTQCLAQSKFSNIWWHYFHLHNSPMGRLLLYPFYRWRNWYFKQLTQVCQLGIQIWVIDS